MFVYVTPLLPQTGSNWVVARQASSQADLVVPIPGTATVDVLGVVTVWIELDGLMTNSFPPHINPPNEMLRLEMSKY